MLHRVRNRQPPDPNCEGFRVGTRRHHLLLAGASDWSVLRTVNTEDARCFNVCEEPTTVKPTTILCRSSSSSPASSHFTVKRRGQTLSSKDRVFVVLDLFVVSDVIKSTKTDIRSSVSFLRANAEHPGESVNISQVMAGDSA